MIIINTVSDKYFELNGVQYAKIYQPLKQGAEDISIVNIYESGFKIPDSSGSYTEFIIDGVVYGSQPEAISALLRVVFELKLSSEIESSIEQKTDKGSYGGTTGDLKDELDEKVFNGVVTYQTLLVLQAVLPIPDEGTAAKVANDGTEANNGYYSIVSGSWVKDADLYENDLNPEGTVRAVTGSAVHNYMAEKGVTDLTSRTNQESNNPAYIRSGQILIDGSGFTTSVNWLALGYQRIEPSIEYTLSGFAAMGTSAPRIVVRDSVGNPLQLINPATATGDLTPVVFATHVDAYDCAVQIGSGAGIGSNPELSEYLNTLMLNKGGAALAYEKYSVINADKIAEKPTKLYLSPVGDDDNLGVESQPLLTLAKAVSLIAFGGDIILKQGDYTDFDLHNLTSQIKSIKAEQGANVRLVYGEKIEAAILTGGTTRVYQAAYAGSINPVSYLWQHDINDVATLVLMTNRHPLHRGRVYRLPSTRLYNASSIAEIESTTNKLMWFLDSGVLYFSKGLGSDLLINPIVIPSAASIEFSEPMNIFMYGIDILYKAVKTKNLKGEIKDSSIGMINGAGAIVYDDTSGLKFTRLEYYACSNDGSNGHVVGNGANPFPFARQNQIDFVDCHGHDNSDDGESCHEFSVVSHKGGLFEFNGNGITPASGGHTMCDGVTTQHNGVHDWTTDQNGTGFSSQGSALDNGVGTNIHCINCISIGDRKAFNGADDDSKFINCVSKDSVISDFVGGQNINSIII